MATRALPSKAAAQAYAQSLNPVPLVQAIAGVSSANVTSVAAASATPQQPSLGATTDLLTPSPLHS